MSQFRILIIEDEQDIRDLISFQMKAGGHSVLTVESADKAIGILEKGEKIDLFIVDWMLPGSMSGLEFTKKLRAQDNYKNIPVIMITALTQADNIVTGLDAGADDYITKPFDLSVLDARVRVQLRNEQRMVQTTQQQNFGILQIDIPKCRVQVENQEIFLTTTEFKILQLLIKRPGHVFTRDQLINSIQGENVFVTGRTVDTHIAGLRKKMGNASNLIETIRGIGYRFKDAL